MLIGYPLSYQVGKTRLERKENYKIAETYKKLPGKVQKKTEENQGWSTGTVQNCGNESLPQR